MTTTLTQAATQLSLRAVSGSPFSLLLNLTVTDSGGTPIAWSAVTSPVVTVEDADGKAVPAAVPTVSSPASGQLLLAWTAIQTAAFYTGRWSLSVTISGVGPQALVAGILTMKKSTLPGPSNPTEELLSVEVGTVTVDIDVTIGGSSLPIGTGAGTVAAGNDGRIVGAVQRGGDTMTGPLVLPGNPTLALQAAPKQYVDAEQTRATAAEAALQATIAGLSATPWVANTAYAAEKIVSNGVGLYEAPTGGVPARATFTAGDWTHLADIALPVGVTPGTVAAGDDGRITGAAQKSANLSDLGSAATARTNLGLGSAATQASSAFDASGAASSAQAAAISAAATDATSKANAAAAAAEAASDPAGSATSAGAAAVSASEAYADTNKMAKSANGADVANPGAFRANVHVPMLAAAQAVGYANVNLASPGATFNGFTLSNSGTDQVLLIAQTTGSQNGPWVWNGATSALTRPTDYPSAGAVKGRQIPISNGSGANDDGSLWVLLTATSITVDTTATTWQIANRVQNDARYDPIGSAQAIRNSTDDGWDIWPLLGQSNELGVDPVFNIVTTDPVHPRVYEWPSSGPNVGQVIQASDPLMHQLGGGQLGPGMPFARWMADVVTPPNRRILLVPCAQSTTGFVHSYDNLHTWSVGNTGANSLYLFAVQQAQAALAAVNVGGGNNRIAGVLWLQGEMDSLNATDAAAYAANLDALIAGFRGYFGATMPFIVVSMEPAFVANMPSGATWSPIVNAAHIDTPRRNLYTGFAYGPANMSLQGGSFGTDTHYTAAGQRINGQRAAEAAVRAKLNVLGTPPVVPTGLALAQSGANLNVSWKQVMGRVTDYTVQYRVTGAGSWTTATRTSPNIDVTCVIPITDGVSYDVQVSSTNEQGTSAYCAFVTLLTVVIPGQVVGLATGTATGASMPLTWTATAGATSYLAQYKAHSSGTWLTFVPTSGPITTNAVTIAGLQPAVSYDFQVQAINAAGSGTFSSTVTASTTNINPPVDDIGVTPGRGYSVRLTASVYAGNCMRVRRDSDNTTLDIGFVNGYIDIAALLAFVGAGSGYINILYDQSGNTRHLTQATAAKQAQIVASGVLNTLNLKAVFTLDGIAQFFGDSIPGMYAAGSATVLAVFKGLTTTASWIVDESRSSTTNAIYTVLGQNSGQPFMTYETDASTFPINATATQKINTQLNQLSFNDTGTVAEQWIRGVPASTGAVGYTRATTTLDRFTVGARITNAGIAAGFANVAIAELLIFYPALTTAQRNAGEANQIAYFAT